MLSYLKRRYPDLRLVRMSDGRWSVIRDLGLVKGGNTGLPDVKVEFKAVAQLQDGADIVISQRELTDRARHQAPSSRHVSVDNFLSSPVYDEVVAEAKASAPAGSPS